MEKHQIRTDALVKGMKPEDAALVRRLAGRLYVRVLRRAKTQTHLNLLICRDCRRVFANRSYNVCPKCEGANVLGTRAVRWGPPLRRHLINYAEYGRLGGIKRTRTTSRADRKRWSSKGGKVRAQRLTAERRRLIAAMGGRARHAAMRS